MAAGRSIARRAALAVVLMFGFYALAIAIATGLLYIPYAELRYFHRVDYRLALFCIIGGGLILWSILPRPDRFEAPGPALHESEHPELFSVLSGVAKLTGQEMPREVYVTPELNAWVAVRGGVMGIGSRRVMGLGLPLLQILSVTRFRAVLAHEFGHYYGGDTALGPWVYKTRAAIGRTIARVAQHSSVLSKPFLWYGLLFLRLTLRVSRQQELSADELAARTVGTLALVEGLKLIHGAALAYNPYLLTEVLPALRKGYRPPVADGFRHFLNSGQISAGVSAFVDAEMNAGEGDPYDSHPPLRERIAALAHLPPGDQSNIDSPAVSLMKDVDTIESKLVPFILSDYAGKGFKPVSWDELPAKVWVPAWRDNIHPRTEWLKALTPTSLTILAKEPSALAVQLRFAAHASVTKDIHRAEAAAVIGSALGLALLARGWSLTALPGDPVLLELGGVSIKPFAVADDLSSGALSIEEWTALCETAGIADVDLGAAAERGPDN